jgi:signal transduction histidine kinase
MNREDPTETAKREIARVVHDLRNPLNAFVTSLALLEAALPEEPGIVRRTLEGMARSVEEMNRLITALAERGAAGGGEPGVTLAR